MNPAPARSTKSRAARMHASKDEPVELSDEDLMLGFARGEDACWAEIVGRYQRRIFNYLLRSVRDQATAEDLVQSTFVRVAEARRHYRPTARFSTWIYTIATNLARDEARRLARHDTKEIVAPDSIASDLPGPERAAETSERARRIAAAVDTLPDSMREALLLAKYEERGYEDIAEILDCTVGAARVRIHRAITMLREQLGVDDDEM